MLVIRFSNLRDTNFYFKVCIKFTILQATLAFGRRDRTRVSHVKLTCSSTVSGVIHVVVSALADMDAEAAEVGIGKFASVAVKT